MICRTIKDFQHWRSQSRALILASVQPQNVQWVDDDGQRSLFGDDDGDSEDAADLSDGGAIAKAAPKPLAKTFSVPKSFMGLAETVGFHRDTKRWDLLYRTLWRIVHDQPQLLDVTTDDDVFRLNQMEKQVRRDAHKMKAFVRFRRTIDEGVEHFIAWHRPDHKIVPKIAPFFARRFNGMNWSILTPDQSVVWDQTQLVFGPGVPRSAAPKHDELEDLWKAYYRSIFNPARVKVKMMKSEMPVRYWDTMPESEIIADLLHEAPRRVEKMIEQHEGFDKTASDFFQIGDAEDLTLTLLQQKAAGCQACDLYQDATQTVFGEGPVDAKIVVLGEQPGDQEDVDGRPFVGPAGRLLNEAFAAAGIQRESVYLTNIVKHFSHTVTPVATIPSDSSDSSDSTPASASSDFSRSIPRHRLHKKPSAREVRCCRPWFDAQWSLLTEAKVLVCLGSTAAKAIIDPGFKISRQRGKFLQTDYCRQTIATWHPAAVLRSTTDGGRQEKMEQLIHDLKVAADVV